MIDKKARSFVMIMMVIAVCALVLRVLIERLIKINITQNESNAAVTLKLISAALENYAKDNLGAYPTNFSLLAQTKPPYLDKDYLVKSPLKGYNYSCLRFEPSGYSCSASPTRCKLTGNTVYTITTGGSLISEVCERKE
jgi:type II secretory pathway pseudopilin PulG